MPRAGLSGGGKCGPSQDLCAHPLSVVIAPAESVADLLAAALRAGLAPLLAARADPQIVVLVDLCGFAPDEPSMLSAAAVEGFIDALLTLGPASVSVASSADSSSNWAGNRDVYARAELAGYRYVTDAGHGYDIIDLGDTTRDGMFAPTSALTGTPASAVWIEADVRIVLSTLRTDVAQGFAAGLNTLIAALPLPNKTLEYHQRRDIGEVVAALLATTPPDFTLIDARKIAIGVDGPRAGSVNEAGFVIASRSPLLADIAAGLKLGVDPLATRLVAHVAEAQPLPPAHRYDGSLVPLDDLTLPTPIGRRHARARVASASVANLTEPWLRRTDATLFPHLWPIDAKANSLIVGLVRGGASATVLQVAIETLFAVAGSSVLNWQTLFAKDMLVRRVVELGFDPATIEPLAFDAMVDELHALISVARDAPDRGDGLRWRKLGGAVVFDYTRDLAIPFDRFVARVDVGHAIQYMNDYLGGLIVPLTRDRDGCPVRQAERNLYLPQPNYLALYGGQAIDVTKIEVVRRARSGHRLYWKTLFSSNGSATADDGIVSFTRRKGGTHVNIIGRQAFTLPPFWKLFDISMIPSIESALITHAYRTFFDNTLANFEALVEGRDIAIGHNPAVPMPLPVRAIEAAAIRVFESAEPWLAGFRRGPRSIPDADGFVHVGPRKVSDI